MPYSLSAQARKRMEATAAAANDPEVQAQMQQMQAVMGNEKVMGRMQELKVCIASFLF